MYTYVVYLGSAFPFYLGEFRTEKAAMKFIENERHGDPLVCFDKVKKEKGIEEDYITSVMWHFGYEREKALEYIRAAYKVETDNIYETYLKQNAKFR